MRRIAVVLVLALACPSCLSFVWNRERNFHEPAANAVDGLRPGQATLADSLGALGAPLYVWEWHADGMALAWGWSDDDRKGLSLSVPVAQRLSASLSYMRDMGKLNGIVLFFDAHAALVELRHGRLSEIHEETAQKRPSFQDEAGS